MLIDFQLTTVSLVHTDFRLVPYHDGGAARNRNGHDEKRRGPAGSMTLGFRELQSFSFPFSLSKSSCIILTAQRSPHIEQVSSSPSRA